MIKIIKKEYLVKSKKLKRKLKIILMSDIHISSIFKINKINEIIKNIENDNINYICIVGDLIDGTNVLEEVGNEEVVLNFLKDLATISRVIISIGNHDISWLQKKRFNTKWIEKRNEKFFEKVKEIKNVYLLDNAVYSDGDVSFIGFTASFDYYKGKNEDQGLLIEEMNDNIFGIDKKKYNILLCHSPIHVLDAEVLKKANLMKNIDLILSGHMHNGMVHPLIENLWRGNSGIITPNKKIFPNAKMTRGMIKKKNKTLIISGGITKLSYSAPNFFHPFNGLFPMNIEIINID